MQLNTNHELQSGKYRIIKTLGQGGFGITYLAEQTMMDRKVCIKEFFLKDYCDRDESTSQVSLGTTNNRALMEKYQEKFLKEARMIAKLDHPNIIRIHDVFTENNTAYYVMDYIEGTNLNDIVKQRGALPEAEAIGIIKAVGEGLAYVHERKITHLDVKPGNIMIRKEDGRPVLIDFGMSKQYDESGEQTSSTPIGVSAGYAPLEQYQVGGVTEFSPQTDIYALGATLYRLVTGQVPPQASDVMNEGLPEMPEAVSESTRNAIEKAMQFRKKDRPSSIEGFLSLLASVDNSPVLQAESKPSIEESDIEEGQTTIIIKGSTEDDTSFESPDIVPEEIIQTTTNNKPQKKHSTPVARLIITFVLFLFSAWLFGITWTDDSFNDPYQYNAQTQQYERTGEYYDYYDLGWVTFAFSLLCLIMVVLCLIALKRREVQRKGLKVILIIMIPLLLWFMVFGILWGSWIDML